MRLGEARLIVRVRSIFVLIEGVDLRGQADLVEQAFQELGFERDTVDHEVRARLHPDFFGGGDRMIRRRTTEADHALGVRDHELAGCAEALQRSAKLFGARGANAGEGAAQVDAFDGLVLLGRLELDENVREPRNAGEGREAAKGRLVGDRAVQIERQDHVLRAGRLGACSHGNHPKEHDEAEDDEEYHRDEGACHRQEEGSHDRGNSFAGSGVRIISTFDIVDYR